MALSIDNINTKVSKATMFGWVLGLIWIGYFGTVPGLTIFDWLILIVAGLFGASLIIGGGMALLFVALTRLITGKSDGSPDLFAWGVVINPIVAFFCVAPVARILV